MVEGVEWNREFKESLMERREEILEEGQEWEEVE